MVSNSVIHDNRKIAQEIISNWRDTEVGSWLVEHSENIKVEQIHDVSTDSQIFAVVGTLSDKNKTFYYLKWGNGR
jgi:hypothetical protein